MTPTQPSARPDYEQRADMLAAVFAERYSCRRFTDAPVPRPTIERILAIAQRTPSWCNAQPWQVTIVSPPRTDPLRAALMAHVQTEKPDPDISWPAEYRGVYLERRRECGFQLYQAVGVARGDRAAGDAQRFENFRFFGAPHVAIVTSEPPLGVYGVLDCGAYVDSFTLAARALGVASIAQAALAAYPAFWRRELGISADRQIVCGISFGYENAEHEANGFRTSRAPLDTVVTWIE